MSGYRNYAQWTKNNNNNNASSNYSNSSTKKESPTSKYESTYSRTRTDAKKNEDKNVSSTLGGKYAYNTGYHRDNSASKDTGSATQKPDIHTRYYEKKESHPPVTYRTLARTGTSRSRDPSPVADKSTSSDSYSYNRLYPRPYTRSVSRERLDNNTSTTPTTIPKYTGRSSINKDDLKYPVNVTRERTESTSSTSKYSTTKDDTPTPKYCVGLTARDRSESTTIPKFTGKTSSLREDLSNKYQLNKSSRTASREDLTTAGRFKSSREDLNKPSQQYINSRFLPKNSVEKSYTSYRGTSATSKSSEILRKNRELLNVINTQSESRSASRASSVAPDDTIKSKSSEESNVDVEMETITVVTRSTSPNPPSQTSIQRIRRVDVARLIEKQITRPVKRGPMCDKEMQSDRLDDSTKYSRFAGASRISATPWSSYLDLKFNSPSSGAKYSRDSSGQSKSNDDASKSQTTNGNSSKSVAQSSSKSDLVKPNDSQSTSGKSKSKLTPPKSLEKKLPPHLPKSESSSKTSSLHSLNTPNKDFRKSVLNMNPDGKSKKKGSAHGGSLSSAESECSESNESGSKSNKLKDEGECGKSRRSVARSARSSTSDSSTTTSGSEDDSKSKSNRIRKLHSAGSSRTSMISGDELSYDTTPKPPVSPRTKGGDHSKSDSEAKSFLMRALAPVTNLFKGKQDSGERVNWMDSSSAENVSEIASNGQNSSPKPKLSFNENQLSPEHSERSVKREKARITIKRIESGEKAWWLESKENSEKRDNSDGAACGKPQWIVGGDSVDGEAKPHDEYCKQYNIRHIDSGERAWWLNSNENLANNDDGDVENANIEDNNMNTDANGSGKRVYKIRHIESGEKAWWLESDNNNSESKSDPKPQQQKQQYKITHIASGERAWWLDASNREYEHSEHSDSDNEIPLGDRASPEGLEMPREDERNRLSPYDNVQREKPKRPTHVPLFISRHTNIDDILGGSSQLLSPLMDRIFGYQEANSFEDDDDDEEEDCEEVDAAQVKIHDSTPQRGVIQPARLDAIGSPLKGCTATNRRKLDDAALQLYKDGDYGSYLDLEASISEQQEEFEGFQPNKKNSIVLRTQLSVRVHTIIEKLYKSEGKELRRALFSLKQIFQEDKDLVHEFVQNDGLSCLIKVGSEADQNYQNYILRALGQVMLYVDGMNGVMEHNKTIQWLYTLISSKFRLVVKTALKLLLVFVEYTDTNCLLLIKAINAVDCSQGSLPWTNIMKLLKDFDSADTELLIYATTLINKCLNGIPDQDTYYDQTDSLEEQSIETIIQRYMSKPGTDLDLLQQFQIYEAVLQYEDGEDKSTPIRHLDENIRKTLRSRKSMCESAERRKSRRHSTGTTPVHSALNNNNRSLTLQANNEDDDESSSSQSSGINSNLNGSYKDNNLAHEAGVTPALRRRRERAERQRSFMREQQENAALLRGSSMTPTDNENIENGNNNYTNGLQQRISNGNNVLNRTSSRKDLTPLLNAVNKLDSEEQNGLSKQPWILSKMYQKSEQDDDDNVDDIENTNETERNLIMQMKENTVKDLTQKLSNQNVLHSPSDENKINRIGDMSGLISKAKEGLAKSKSQANVLKSPTGDNMPKGVEAKKSENELRWEELAANLDRPLNLCDMDFTDLTNDDDADILTPIAQSNGIPPPPPPLLSDNSGTMPPPPPLGSYGKAPSIVPPSPPAFGVNLQRSNKCAETKIPIKKNKKTVKLFWKEVRDDPVVTVKLKSGFIWDELAPVTVDTQKLEHLFESRAKDLITKKQQEMNKNKEIIVLDPKRSNAINIGMTKLPPPRSIKTAILKMDATIMNREGIEKLLTMLPTEEERTKIQEAQAANPDLPLGSAEQFLLTLASISELPARLKLWAFKLDFENTEREIAEPLMDLKQGMELLKANKTFRAILSTLLSIGNFLNGNEVKGFQIEYLSKVPEVKDTVHKHSLLHHLCHIVMEKFAEASDLYSEIGAITRASKIDFDELTLNIQRLEADCKASWDHLKLIAKHDGSTMMKVKMSDFLADCAERIILLGIIHRKVMNRFHKFLLWLGIPLHQISETKPNELSRIVSEFALEYRTTRERVLQQLEKKANHRERNKTRGKMITETGKFRSKEDRADAELRQLLGSDISDVDSLQGTWRRPRRESSRFLGQINGNLTDGDDEILESLVKTATKVPTTRSAQRERKRTRHADRKSLKRSRTRENNPFGSRDSP